MSGRRGRLAIVAALAMMLGCGGPDGSTVGMSDPPPSVGPSLPHTTSPRVVPVVARAAADSPDVPALAAGLNQVGLELFEQATANSGDDVVLSPLSIGLAFGMADVGASGPTAEALAELFAYPVTGQARWSAFNTLEQAVTDVGDSTVTVANREFPDVSFVPVDGYNQRLERWFGAGIQPLPLRDDSEASRQQINDWVADQTQALIPELLPEGAVNGNSVMFLVNALYQEADWELQFGKYPTEDATFTLLDGSATTVALMHEMELTGPAVATDTYVATEVPYADGDLSMLVIVPTEGNYEAVQRRLGDELLAEVDATVEPGTVELFLPRFESDSQLDLRVLMEDGLGVDDVFGGAGQWDGIAPDIVLDSAVHAADIAVDEYGTVAAAATALGFEESGPPEPDVIVRADRPFLYLIRHQPTGAIMFVGRVLDPASTA